MKHIFTKIFVMASAIGFAATACSESAGRGKQRPLTGLTATELVSKITVGWNLGNTLDCADSVGLGANPSVSQWETAWDNPVTT